MDPLQQLSRMWAFAFRTIEPQNRQVGFFLPSSEPELIFGCSTHVEVDVVRVSALTVRSSTLNEVNRNYEHNPE